MLSAVHRLTDSDGFRRTVRHGRRAGCSTMVVHLRVDPDAAPGPVQVGFTVSKAVGNAATRASYASLGADLGRTLGKVTSA